MSITKLPSDRSADAEIAVLVSQALNLETFSAPQGSSDGFRSGSLPICIQLFIKAGLCFSRSPQGYHAYRNLRTIDVSLMAQYDTQVAHLFYLPSLQELTIRHAMLSLHDPGAAFPTWPIPSNVVDITSLKLYQVYLPADVVSGMIRSCKALTSFECDVFITTPNSLDAWCAEVVEALQKHCESLNSLELLLGESQYYDRLEMTFRRVKGLQSLRALETLGIPFYVLMGKPSGEYVHDVWIPDPGQEEYPALKDVLPPGLRKLTVHAGHWSAFGNTLETTFTSYLQPEETRIERVSLLWDHLELNCPLPMDFWRIMKFYFEHDVSFEYTLQPAYGKSHPQNTCPFSCATYPSTLWYYLSQ